MKKNLMFAMFGAIALTGSVGITSCTSENDVAEEISPYFDSDKNEVVTNFVFNVSNASRESTRQSADATQATASNQFRGIDNAKLFCFVNGDAADGKHLASAKAFNKKFDLAHVLSAGQVTASASTVSASHRIIEIALPLKTNSLVFYGKAPEETVTSAESTAGLTANDVYGSIESNTTNENATNLSELCFSVATRLGNNATKYHEVEKLLAAVLTCIMNTNLSKMVAVSATDKPTGITTSYAFAIEASDAVKAIKWEDYANTSKKSPANENHTLYPLEEKLADVYKQMTSIKTSNGELRAASGDAICSMVQDMWTVLNEVRWAIPLSYEEAVAKLFAVMAFDNINSFFNYTSVGTSGGVVSGTSLESLANLITEVASNSYWPTSETTPKPTTGDFSNISASTSSDEKDMSLFPSSFCLPKGAAHVMYDDTKKIFAYPSSFNTSGMGTEGSFSPEDYFYCPEILYFANSSIRTSANDHKSDYPDGVSNWINEDSWSADWTGLHVTSSTRSVAMKDNIHYGISLLKTTVGVKSGVTFYDNNHKIQKDLNPSIGDTDEPDHEVTIGESTFTLTGVIVGGQSRNVGWDFIPRTVTVGESTGYQNGFTYDNAIPSDAQTVPTAPGKANYTMLFDNYSTEATQSEVAVALEFYNNGPAFYGNYNLIPQYGTFYLIGKLNPNKDGLADISWPQDHDLPPYNSNGTSNNVERVFMQDYMTTAHFVIGEKSLQAAYLTVPDLRATSLTLGLSVDIDWSTGLNFSDVELGK